jgi:transcriptional regulator with XRE-family HTH domain
VDLDQMLGIDPNDALTRRARRLLEADRRLIAELVARRNELDLNQDEVARRMDTSQSVVARIEAGDRDMHQSTILRYAMAVGVTIEHTVVPDDPALDRSSRVLADLQPEVERHPWDEGHVEYQWSVHDRWHEPQDV